MESFIVLMMLALILGVAGLVAFFWSMRTKQYEDLDGAAHRILLDDE
ncbi:MAG: cbb3-type cytochrome oxidase assembly protein CcoS [Alphaproteobacteria bacterium]|nr:MAG: cbb3-type cytochrome oxidase assembly protein CcoS [Alphaproteobacteria bacterium]TAE80905.1 MAG: cbb3-type cytochrome oxidase assembly protein CcoS [Alphaproteobacteria bacterium]TAF14449.1 MAG: cbb3-type cytochrome oxidase assembly protein CcoS [Alphaproteobacteria bacterium]TAF39863.1 MAG: cbb3-type cytochrome oxidase assembly protein CcoS [Alphaproteobacteria bacterium]TAF77603.1 MAG: cbb3-type cytochrome oxidase assembly protein CcoS [Alphaproteobacteria bacterium]